MRNISGTWISQGGKISGDAKSDGGIYDINQDGNEVFIHGKSKDNKWENCGHGTIINDSQLEVEWMDTFNSSGKKDLRKKIQIYQLIINDDSNIVHAKPYPFSFGNLKREVPQENACTTEKKA
jgi:hypothetical protein